MKVMFALAERDGYPVGENWPELVAAVDEGTQDDNPDAYWQDVERARGAWGGEMGEVRHFVIDVPDDVIEAAFAPNVVDAAVTEVTESHVHRHQWRGEDYVCGCGDILFRIVPKAATS